MSENKKSFLLGSYGSLSDGLKEVDNVLYNGVTGEKYIDQKTTPVTSFITDEHFKIYEESGLTVIKCGSEVCYNGEPFETSLLKKTLDLCLKYNIKAIIGDARLDNLARKEDLSETFSTEKELNEYVADCIKDYCDHPALFAVSLIDEPSYKLFSSIGKIYKAIKAYRSNNKIIVNLLPLTQTDVTAANFCEGGNKENFVQAYEKYLQRFVDETGADYIMYDIYPFCENEDGATRIGRNHLLSVKVSAEFCKKRNLAFYLIVQSFDMEVYDSKTQRLIPYYRKCTAADLAWQANLAMGAGVEFMLYFTYFPHRGNSTKSEMFGEEGCFLLRNGETTPLYSAARDLHVEMQRLAPTILKYRYNKMGVFCGEGLVRAEYLEKADCLNENFEKISAVKVEKDGAVLITEMFNANTKSFGYMIINILDPSKDKIVDCEISFNRNNSIKCFYGEDSIVGAFENSLRLKLNPGQGVFVEVKEDKA